MHSVKGQPMTINWVPNLGPLVSQTKWFNLPEVEIKMLPTAMARPWTNDITSVMSLLSTVPVCHKSSEKHGGYRHKTWRLPPWRVTIINQAFLRLPFSLWPRSRSCLTWNYCSLSCHGTGSSLRVSCAFIYPKQILECSIFSPDFKRGHFSLQGSLTILSFYSAWNSAWARLVSSALAPGLLAQFNLKIFPHFLKK